jgi:ABC-type thiamin/hydroxymethylpyrimidine transport system permease subunit
MNGCLRAWKAEEQVIAGILMVVVGMVFIWQVSRGVCNAVGSQY